MTRRLKGLTSRRVAALAGAGALACTGFALAASPASADTPPPTTKQQACDKAPWAPRVEGHPAGFGAGSVSGDYLWHTDLGFHLRVTHGHTHDGRVYTGEIHSGTPMRLEPVRLEGKDTVALSANAKTIYFSFENHGYIDGINFHTDCARTLTLSKLDVGGHALPTSHVNLGYYEAHPKHVPFSVHRYGGPKAQ
ncbi:hypothetical protein [Jatrophihabitans endophyticus]|uniref:hypothetical protein n=1 Tax=Jatrophihabitans endophyticus TaxID=1206085 RepID=UPI0019E3904D|nr:hypothetical protein [Jatrophihabitans endophyticus]MBE7189701.1 hypothetical protein [Jatrophihabitans endophyticus]